MNILKLFLTLGLMGIALLGQAQLLPTWTVYPGDYPDAATITFELNADEAPLTGPGNLLLAQVDGEVRGVAQAVEVAGRQVFFLTIYGAQARGEKVSFQAYWAAKDSLFDVQESITFSTFPTPNSPERPWPLHLKQHAIAVTEVAPAAAQASPRQPLAQSMAGPVTKVFPNPTRGAFFVEGEGLVAVEVSNLQGQRLHRQALSPTGGQLDLNLPVGLYVLRMEQQHGEQVRLLRVE